MRLHVEALRPYVYRALYPTARYKDLSSTGNDPLRCHRGWQWCRTTKVVSAANNVVASAPVIEYVAPVSVNVMQVPQAQVIENTVEFSSEPALHVITTVPQRWQWCQTTIGFSQRAMVSA